MIEVAKSFRSSEWALWREVMLPYTLPYTMTGVRQAIGRALVGMVAAEFFLSSTGLGQLIMGASQNFDTAGVFASILGHRLDRRRIDAARPRRSSTISRAGEIDVAESTVNVSIPLVSAPKRSPLTERLRTTFLPRLLTGIVLLLVWEFVVRALAPAYVAKPSTVVMAIPRVIIDPAFLKATGATLTAVAEGLAIALVFGTIIGLLIGRSTAFDRAIRHLREWLQRDADDRRAAAVLVVVRLFERNRIATIIFAAIFAIIVNVADGARSVPREYH